MGLDCTHDAYHGAYGSFSRWREKLGEVAGYTFHDREDGSGPMIDIDWGSIEALIGRDLLGKWPAMPVRPNGQPDPLILLFAHSDCEGELQTEYLEALADRLEALLPELDGKDGGGHVGDYGDKTRQFIAGCRAAAEAGEPLGFH